MLAFAKFADLLLLVYEIMTEQQKYDILNFSLKDQ